MSVSVSTVPLTDTNAYLGSCGRSKSGRPASTTFCLTQSISHEGRMISVLPLFCSDATFTVPGLCQSVVLTKGGQ